ncbi:MAG: hypothetical protein DRQ88_11365 [Epsilonproteobacteria bacterium]|nr:MAG: hypothetical protein DRQ88_11365 [Campylobacterota bacterium]RLA65816.1 MAG: hypothetical protein DRQ89_00240 [Campylobacterota bacterium]
MRIIFLFLFLISPLFAQDKIYEVDKILQMEINSSINPAILSYLKEGFKAAKDKGAQLILIKLNTPGGLVSTTKDILTLMGGSDIPTVIWITPEGASATSAGALIASGAHILLMAEGTNMGSATPIEITGDIKKGDMKKKAMNSLIGLIQSLAESRGRNPEAFGEMVKNATTYKSLEALEKKLIDGLANKEKDVFDAINNKMITIRGTTYKLVTNNPVLILFEMDAGQKLLNIFANPSLAYILFLIGAALIYFELQAPGGFIAGSVGAIFLILAAIGFQVLPLNFGGIGLIVLSFILFILEAYITSYGIFTLAGISSLVAGSLFLFRTDDAYIELSTSVIASVVGAIVIFIGLIGYFLYWDIGHKKKKKHDDYYTLKGKHGTVTTELESHEEGIHVYQIKISGEIWKAKSKHLHKIGDIVEVIGENKEEIYLEI